MWRHGDRRTDGKFVMGFSHNFDVLRVKIVRKNPKQVFFKKEVFTFKTAVFFSIDYCPTYTAKTLCVYDMGIHAYSFNIHDI